MVVVLVVTVVLNKYSARVNPPDINVPNMHHVSITSTFVLADSPVSAC
jgi:hypothetical protein